MIIAQHALLYLLPFKVKISQSRVSVVKSRVVKRKGSASPAKFYLGKRGGHAFYTITIVDVLVDFPDVARKQCAQTYPAMVASREP
jgi:hypothetical protein